MKLVQGKGNLALAKIIFLAQLETLKIIEKDKGKELIYLNQERLARRMLEAFEENEDLLYLIVIAPTQSGKTGSMIALINHFVSMGYVPVDNIFIITGLSDKMWKAQTGDRCPECLRGRVFHLNDLMGKFMEQIKGKEDVLLIIDELHIAANQDQTLSKVFNIVGLSDPDYCYGHNIKFVDYSATPGGFLKDRKLTGNRYKIIRDDPPPNYVGPIELLNRGSLRPITDLSKRQNVVDLFNFIMDKFWDRPRYHFVRLHKKKEKSEMVQENIYDLCTEHNEKFNTISSMFSQDGNVDDIEALLSETPKKHTFIFIKDKVGCAKTIENKQHIGVWVSRFSNKYSAGPVIQDLRLTGYNVPDDVFVFCNLELIQHYKKWWESDFTVSFDALCSSNKQTRGVDSWAKDLLQPRTTSDKSKNLKYFIFDTREEAAKCMIDNFPDWKMNDRCEYRASEPYHMKTTEELALMQYNISTKGRFKRVIRGVDGKFAVYWDGDHPKAP